MTPWQQAYNDLKRSFADDVEALHTKILKQQDLIRAYEHEIREYDRTVEQLRRALQGPERPIE